MPESLQATWSQVPERRDQRRPRLQRPGRDRRLRDVVDDEPDVRQPAGEVERRGQLARAGRGGRRRGPPGRRPRSRGRRRRGSASPGRARRGPGGGSRRGGRRRSVPQRAAIVSPTPGSGQVDPADDAADERRLPGDREEVDSVSSRLERVWTRTVASTPAAQEVRLEVGRPERAGGSGRGRRSATGSRPVAGSQKWWWASTITVGPQARASGPRAG